MRSMASKVQSATQNLRGRTGGRAPARFVTLAIFAALPFSCHSTQPESASSARTPLSAPSLDYASSFAVLGGTAVNNTGLTILTGGGGSVGVAPGLAITGFPPGIVEGGSLHAGDATALQAQSSVTTAYIELANEACTQDLTGQDLGGLTLTPGVYCFSSEAQLTGKLVLDAQGDFSAVFIFKIGSTLTTASNAVVTFSNNGNSCQVFWQVGSSATLGTDTGFGGNLLALTSITLDHGATIGGRVLARNGAVTMDTNGIYLANAAHSGSFCTGEHGPADAGVDGTAAESGGADAGVDGTLAESGSSSGGEAGVDGSGADTSSGGEAGGSLCCGGVLCGTSCTKVSGDVANCGSCGHACASDEFCAAGACVQCSPVCGGACVDLVGDQANCGSCGHACLATEACISGACAACPSVCGGACVDFTADHANCGSCGHVCLGTEVCNMGACAACSSVCGGACVDLGNDPLNCGSCGHSCAPGGSCKSGSCICQ